jgi:formylglycine-generating enzyme required for sulfatase activity
MNCRRCSNSFTGNPRFCPTCHEFVPESLIGQTLGGKYDLLDVLGVGGMGAVYRARRRRIGDEVVVKTLLPSLSQESARFHREAEAAASVKHSNVVVIHDSDDARGELPAFIAMEMVKGVTLRRLLQSEGRLEPRRAVMLMRRICAGVGAAHRLGVVHRDLKPENVMVVPPEEDGEAETVKVLDFGIAKLLDKEATRLTQYGTVLGTGRYMPPEQWRGEEVDARADVYSLGVMLYEMLTGKHPFTGRTRDELMMKHLLEPPPPLTLDRGALPELEAVIKRALAKERDARPVNARAFGHGLQEAIEASVVPPTMTNSVGIEFVWIPPGSFMMGSNSGAVNERPAHQVTIQQGFYMGRYEVTQGQWRKMMGTTVRQISGADDGPDEDELKAYQDVNKGVKEWLGWVLAGEGDQHPMYYVSWNDAQDFIRRLNALNDGYTYRLPSESEWEYACRAGTSGDYADRLDAVAWHDNNSGSTTHPVGQKQPNGFGLYDMHGNVWEWCEDWKHENYNGAPTDGSSWMSDEDWVSGGDSGFRVLRGGSWINNGDFCRSAARKCHTPDFRGLRGYIGFRVVAVSRA